MIESPDPSEALLRAAMCEHLDRLRQTSPDDLRGPGHFLPDLTTAVSLLDRLFQHATVVVTEGKSYRTREARQKKGRPLRN